MKQVELDDVKEKALSLAGKTLKTRHRGARFHVRVGPEGLIYTPMSSGKPRSNNDWQTIQRVLDRFNGLQSFFPSDYMDLSWHAPYLLVIIHSISQ